MIPLWKSHYSIGGKSILTLSETTEEGGADSIFSLMKKENMDKLILVEDTMIGFLEAVKRSEEQDVQLIFGLRVTLCGDSSIPKKDSKEDNCEHKIIIFAKNDSGCKRLYEIYSAAFVKGEGRLDEETLKESWSDEDLSMEIPFYDSFIFKNTMGFNNCTPHLKDFSPSFFIERNDLPFDHLIEEKVRSYCKSFNYKINLSKSIYYNKRADFEAFQAYRCICSRNFGRQSTLTRPNLDHFASREFSFESYLENKDHELTEV
jgi:DNA polymerase III alpha subunit|tara:strand:+ start:262 stop:1044 length:783 start_codon:yes stop_codon:yes gene_type:complete